MLKMNIQRSNTRRESITFNISVVKEEKEDHIELNTHIQVCCGNELEEGECEVKKERKRQREEG